MFESQSHESNQSSESKEIENKSFKVKVKKKIVVVSFHNFFFFENRVNNEEAN